MSKKTELTLKEQQLQDKFLQIKDFQTYLDNYHLFATMKHTPSIFSHMMYIMESDDMYTHRQKEALINKKKGNLKKIFTDQLNMILQDIKDYGDWNLEGLEDKDIQVTYIYPKGKNEAIKHEIALNIATSITKQDNIYIATINSHHYKEIVLMYFNFDAYNRASNDELDNHEVEDFLLKHYRPSQLNGVIASLKKHTEDYRSIHSTKNPMVKEYVLNIKKELQDKRNIIYQQLIVDDKEKGKWISEQKVFKLVHEKYNDAIYQYKPDWLDGQSLDIFIPALNAAIEYNGAQHYEEIEFFGGREAFEDNKQRDWTKRSKCKYKGVKLVYWAFYEPITKEWFEKIIVPLLEE